MRSFKQYHEQSPEVYEAFKKYAFQLINRGYKRIGAKQIFEVIRWHSMVSGNDKYKCNNNYTADYARKFEKDFPDHFGIFSKRLCNSDK